MRLKDIFWREPLWQRKALNASPEVLEAVANRQMSFMPLIATPNRGDAVRAAFERSVSASYGWMYANQPAVRTVVDYIARNIAQLALRLYERTSDIERHEASDHGAAVALRNPNPQTPGQKFIFNMVRDHLVYGNAYALKFREDGGPLMFAQLPPDRTSVIGPAYFTVDAYRIYRADGSSFDRPPGDMVHWLGSTNPDDPRLGLSPLETLRRVLAEDEASQAATVELLKAGLLKPGYISRPLDAPTMSREASDRFVEKWANALRDTSRHTPILEEGMEFKDFGTSPKDAEMLSGRQFTREEVARQYGMVHCPPEGEEERTQFLADVLPPVCEMLAAFLDLQVVRAEFLDAKDYYFEFDLDEKAMGNDRLTALTSACGAPPLTRNEARAMLDKPPKPEGDDLITPLNVTVGGKPSPMVMPIQDPNAPAQDGSARNGNQSMNGDGKALYLARFKAQSRRRDRYAEESTEMLRKFFATVERSTRSKVASFDAARWVKELTAAFLRWMRLTVEREAGYAAASMGLADFDMALVEHYLAATAEGKAQEVVAKLQEKLAGIESSESVFKMARETWAPARGIEAATHMTNFAHIEAAGQTPDASHRHKRWIVSNTETSAHPEMDGEVVGLTERFSNGKEYPPYEHPHCLCLVDVR